MTLIKRTVVGILIGFWFRSVTGLQFYLAALWFQSMHSDKVQGANQLENFPGATELLLFANWIKYDAGGDEIPKG